MWLNRLVAEIEKRHADGTGVSLRKISTEAGLGPNFVSQLMADNWKEPSFGRVVKLCDYMDISVTYIVTGAEMSHMQEQMLSQLAAMPEHQQRSVVGLLRTLSSDAQSRA